MAEVVAQGGRRVCREKMGQSAERATTTTNNNNNNNKGVCVVVRPRMTAAATMRPPPAFKKVEIVYYLSRNGHLEHPHYIEVTHLSHQQLRLKDFMDRLTVLRGKGMPSLYSWSCKRSYKNGYVWNDLAENDVIYPSQGAEYVLKGSELLFQGSCNDKFHHLQLANGVQPKRNSLASKPRNEPEEMSNDRCSNRHHHGEEEEEDDEIEEFKHQEAHKNGSSDLLLSSFSSPPSSTASSTISDKANNDTIINNNDKHNSKNNNNNSSKRFEDGDQVGNEPLLSRNSMLLSLIACGGSASFRKAVPPPSPCTTGLKSCGGGRVAVKVVEDNETTIGRISEDPKLHGEEKEYFSGSIVESITMERIEVSAGLKKSSSHNEERSTKTGLGGVTDEEVEREKGFKGKCIPRKKSSSKHSKE